MAVAEPLSLRWAQGEVFKADERFRVLVAGRRFGKSYLSCVELLKGSISKPGVEPLIQAYMASISGYITCDIMTNKTMILKDSLDGYFIRIMNLKEQGEIAPIEYVKEEIKSILLNQRKLKTVEVIKTKLFEDAKQSNQLEIY